MSHKYQKACSRIATVENQLADKIQECEAQQQTIVELGMELYTEADPNAPPSKKIKKKSDGTAAEKAVRRGTRGSPESAA